MTPAEFRALAGRVVPDDIDRAVARAIDYTIARTIAPKLGVSRQAVDKWLDGTNPVNPTAAALVAVLADGERE